MNNKRSYLESLNNGRPRRPVTSIEELNRTLEALESRLDAGRQPPHVSSEAQGDHIARRIQQLAGQASWPQPELAAAPQRERAGRGFDGLARDIERTRIQEEGITAVSRIAAELKDLRDELRHQMTDGLRKEFDLLRRDIERAYAAAAAGAHGPELGQELERLSTAIQALAGRGDDDSVEKLRSEIDQVKQALGVLAREETLHSVGQRWDDFDRRWNASETRRSGQDGALEAVNARLDEIQSAVNGLPETLPLHSLEDKVRTLAGVIDQFSRQQHAGPEALEMIGDRLDEISRAIVASSVSTPVTSYDPKPFERVEARITSLARQIEELADDRPVRQVMDGLSQLTERLDEMSRRTEMPEKAVKALARQVEEITQRLDAGNAAEAERMLENFETRFAGLADMMERRHTDASEQGRLQFRDLERRLDLLAERLDARSTDAEPIDSAALAGIESRLATLAERVAAPVDAGMIRSLEARLEDISIRLELSARKTAGIDPELIRNLEAQVANLSEHLSRPGAPLHEFEDMGPRLDQIEQSIAQSRDTILSAARQAAQEAIRGAAGGGLNEETAALARDLKSLDKLARRSDERNAKTFEAIHDTLLKIVERLGALEASRSERQDEVAVDDGYELAGQGKLSLNAAPPMEPAPFAPSLDEDEFVERSPAEAAAAAALAAMSGEAEERPQGRKRKRSVLGGFARAFSGRAETTEPVALAGDSVDGNLALAAPEMDLDEPLDPKIANRPLEPGSGAPDLNAIIKRVRDERAPSNVLDRGSDVAKSDFIAAARRAAQAAAAEAEVLKKQADKNGPDTGKFGFGGLLRSRRKMLLAAAAATTLALGGWQLGSAFLADSGKLNAARSPVADDLEAKAEVEPEEAVVSAPAVEESAEASAGEPAVRSVEIAAAATDAAPDLAAAKPQPAEAVATPIETAAIEPATGATVAVPVEAEQPAASEPESEEAPPASAVAEIPKDAGPLALREAAAGGDARALFVVGSRYGEDRGGQEDLVEAAKWYERAAEQGFAPAQYRIGNFYEKGLGVARDIAKAKTWYQLAAAQGNASAMHNLAVLFAMGADGTPDNESAARWFLEAAELGVTDSQFNLGILTAKGVGMPQNLEESYKWFALVAKTGDQDAAAKRDEVAKALAPEKLEKARASAELWRAKPLDPKANGIDIPEAWQDPEETTASIDLTEAVKTIQLTLNEKGYDAGSADGIMGEKTKAAIAAFQKARGMPSTGKVDKELVQALLETR